MPRQPNGRPKIFRGADGLYHCFPTIGKKPNGDPKRKHIKHKRQDVVKTELDAVMARYNKGQDVTVKVGTFAEHYDTWLETVIRRRVRMGERAQNTYDDYESVGRVHLKPNLGHYKLIGRKHRLEPEHFEEMYAVLAERGLSKSYIKRIHVIARRFVKEAYRRGWADRVVTELFDAPEFRAAKIKALKLGDAQAALAEAVADNDELAARWVLGILNGPRQGEVLGLHWTDVDLDPEDADEVPNIKPVTQIQRQTWRHGCPDPVQCVKNRKDKRTGMPKNPCRTKACPPKYKHGCTNPASCKKLAHFCPQKEVDLNKQGKPLCSTHTRLSYCKPCDPECAGHASTCESRKDGGLVETRLKTEGSEAAMALPKVLVEMLRKHRERQIRQFAEKGLEWKPEVHCFTDSRGKPIDPRRDWGAWALLLERAGVKHTRLHAARHTTGTYLRATGSDMKMIKEVLRHVDPNISGVYTEEGMDAKRAAVERVAAALMDGDLSMIMGAKRVAL